MVNRNTLCDGKQDTHWRTGIKGGGGGGALYQEKCLQHRSEEDKEVLGETLILALLKFCTSR